MEPETLISSGKTPLSFRDLLETVPIGVFIVDARGCITDCNDTFLGMANAPRSKVIGFDLIHSSRDPSLIPHLEGALAGTRAEFDTPYTSTTGGKASYYHYVFQPLEPPRDNAAVLCFAQDLYKLKIMEATHDALRLSEQKFSQAFRNNPDPMLISVIDTGIIHEVNWGFSEFFGYSAAETLGRTTLEIGLWADPVQRAQVVALMRENGSLVNHEVEMRTRDGRIVTVLGSASQLVIEGQPYWLVQFRDITERRHLLREIEKQANTDYLTDIPNRRCFMKEAEQELDRARRYARPLTLLMLDLDHFKALNDRHGHLVGDAMLQSVARCFVDALREFDRVGRIGGEEFALFLPETGYDQACEVAERIRQKVALACVRNADDQEVTMTISIGIATRRPDDTTIDALLARADLALYAAKAAGRNCYRYLD